MPQVLVGAAVAGLVAGSSFAAGALAIGFSFATFATSLVLGALSYALTPRPKKGTGINPVSSNTLAVRQSDLTRQIVYGHTRISRGYAHMAVQGTNNKLHLFIMLCEGELRAINEVWLDDYCIPPDWIDADGFVTQGRYSGKLRIRKHLGADDQEADPVAIASLTEWTTNHRLQGIAYIYAIMTKDQDVYPNGVPNISAIVEGPTKFDPRENGQVWSTNVALFCHDFIRNDTYGFGAFEDDVDLDNVAAQANICDEMVDTDDPSDAIAVAVASSNPVIDIATDIITLTGDMLRFQFGDRVRVTSTGTIPGGLAALTDYYVIPYQVKTKPRILLASSLENAMNKVAVDITSVGSGTVTVTKTGEPRYHGSGIIDTEDELTPTLNNLASSMAGRAVCIGGFWTLFAGAWRTPTVTFGISDMRSALGYKNCLSMSDSFNIVKGLFISPLNSYQSSDYPAARYNQFIDDDNGLEAPRELNLPFTNRPTTAQRIAKIELFRGRQDITVTCDFSGKGLQVQPCDNIMLDVERLGWEGKYFEITEFSFDISQAGIVTHMVLRETAQEIFDWDDGEAILFDPAPNTNLPNPFDVLAPTGVAYSSREIETAASDKIYALVLSWDQHPDYFVTEFGQFEIQFKLSDETLWRPSFKVDGKIMESDLISSSVNVFYDLRIRAINNIGVRSGWVTILGAVAGSSGGVTKTYDYRFVNEVVGVFNDWGNVYDAPGPGDIDDWGFVV